MGADQRTSPLAESRGARGSPHLRQGAGPNPHPRMTTAPPCCIRRGFGLLRVARRAVAGASRCAERVVLRLPRRRPRQHPAVRVAAAVRGSGVGWAGLRLRSPRLVLPRLPRHAPSISQRTCCCRMPRKGVGGNRMLAEDLGHRGRESYLGRPSKAGPEEGLPRQLTPESLGRLRRGSLVQGLPRPRAQFTIRTGRP